MKTEPTSKNKKRAKDIERTLLTWSVGLIIMILVTTFQGYRYVSVRELSGVTFLLLVTAVILSMVRKHREERDPCPGMLARKELDA